MGGDNAALLRETFRRWSEGDLEGTLEFISPEVRWEPSGLFPGASRDYRGHAGVRSFWDTFREPWEHIEMEAEEILELEGCRMLTTTRFRGVGRTSGVETQKQLFQIWTIDDGLIVRYQSFGTREEALAAAPASSSRSPSAPRTAHARPAAP